MNVSVSLSMKAETQKSNIPKNTNTKLNEDIITSLILNLLNIKILKGINAMKANGNKLRGGNDNINNNAEITGRKIDNFKLLCLFVCII